MSIKKFIIFAMLIALFKMDNCAAGENNTMGISVQFIDKGVRGRLRPYSFPKQDSLSGKEIKQAVLKEIAPDLDSNDPRVLNAFVVRHKDDFISEMSYPVLGVTTFISLYKIHDLEDFDSYGIKHARVALEISKFVKDETTLSDEKRQIILRKLVEEIKKYDTRYCMDRKEDALALCNYVLSDESPYSDEQKEELRSFFIKAHLMASSNVKKASASFSDKPRPSQESSDNDNEDSTGANYVDQVTDIQLSAIAEEIKSETSPGLHISHDQKSAVLKGTAEEIQNALYAHRYNLGTIGSLVIHSPNLSSVPVDLGKALNLKTLNLSDTAIVATNDTNGIMAMLKEQGCTFSFPEKE